MPTSVQAGRSHSRLAALLQGRSWGAVLGARRLSPGDAGLALGQAWVALHQLASIKEN